MTFCIQCAHLTIILSFSERCTTCLNFASKCGTFEMTKDTTKKNVTVCLFVLLSFTLIQLTTDKNKVLDDDGDGDLLLCSCKQLWSCRDGQLT